MTWNTLRQITMDKECAACGADAGYMCEPTCTNAQFVYRTLHGALAALTEPCVVCGADGRGGVVHRADLPSPAAPPVEDYAIAIPPVFYSLCKALGMTGPTLPESPPDREEEYRPGPVLDCRDYDGEEWS